MNKCTLIIDGNWLLQSRSWPVIGQFDSNYSQEILNKSRENLTDVLAQSINKTYNIFKDVVDNILIVRDGGSWRKTVEKPKSYQTEYKGNREVDNTYDWKMIYGALDDLVTNAKDYNITCSISKNIEGDDWIWYWSDKLNNEGVNTIIWSTDADLKQLIKFNSNCWTCWYNDKKLVYPETQVLNELDSFMEMVNPNEFLLNKLKQIIKDNESVYYGDIIMSKIICGDSGDNIMPLLQCRKNNKNIGISQKEWSSIKSHLNITTLEEFFDKQYLIITNAIHLKRFSSYEFDLDELRNRFKYNTQLVYLSKDSYPDNIYNLMNESKEDYKVFDVEIFKNNYKILSTSKIFEEKELFEDVDFEGLEINF